MRVIIRSNLFILFILMSIQVVQADSNEQDFILSQYELATAEELENARGREGIDINILNNMNAHATLTGNTATNNTTGMNIITNGAFAEAGGMFSVIQNSGNNVIIQDTTIVNVTIIP